MVLDLRAEVAYLKRLIHGARSEGLSTIDPAQTSLDLGDLSAVPVAANDDQPDGSRRKARGFVAIAAFKLWIPFVHER